MSLQMFIAAFVSILLGAMGQLFLKIGAGRLAALSTDGGVLTVLLNAVTVWQLILGLVFYASSAFVWIYVLSVVNLSTAYPMVGLGFVIVILMGVLVLREPVSVMQAAGSVMILTGIVMVTRG